MLPTEHLHLRPRFLLCLFSSFSTYYLLLVTCFYGSRYELSWPLKIALLRGPQLKPKTDLVQPDHKRGGISRDLAQTSATETGRQQLHSGALPSRFNYAFRRLPIPARFGRASLSVLECSPEEKRLFSIMRLHHFQNARNCCGIGFFSVVSPLITGIEAYIEVFVPSAIVVKKKLEGGWGGFA